MLSPSDKQISSSASKSLPVTHLQQRSRTAQHNCNHIQDDIMDAVMRMAPETLNVLR